MFERAYLVAIQCKMNENGLESWKFDCWHFCLDFFLLLPILNHFVIDLQFRIVWFVVSIELIERFWLRSVSNKRHQRRLARFCSRTCFGFSLISIHGSKAYRESVCMQLLQRVAFQTFEWIMRCTCMSRPILKPNDSATDYLTSRLYRSHGQPFTGFVQRFQAAVSKLTLVFCRCFWSSSHTHIAYWKEDRRSQNGIERCIANLLLFTSWIVLGGNERIVCCTVCRCAFSVPFEFLCRCFIAPFNRLNCIEEVQTITWTGTSNLCR